MIRLPSTGLWRSTQNGDTFGEIVASRNVDLQLDGKVKLARKAMGLFSYGLSYDSLAATDPGMQGTVLGIVTSIGNGTDAPTASFTYYVTEGGAYGTYLGAFGTSTVLPNTTNQPTFGADSDIVNYQGRPHVSGGIYVSELALVGSAWTARRINSLTSGVPHPMCVIEQLNQLAVGNGNTVKTFNTSYVLQTTLTLPSEYYVVTMRWRQNNLYIGTRNIYGGEAKMFIWSGSGTSAQQGFGCGADWIYSMCEYQGRMAIVTSAAQIRTFNGGGFDDLANFPVFYTPYSWATTKALNYSYGRVANRGMTANGSFLYINIDGSINGSAGVAPGTHLHNQPSGLWEYSPRSGLWHKAGLNFDSRLRLVPTELNSSFLKFSTAHQASTGDPVVLSNSSLTGVSDGQVYYAIPGSTTTTQLALTPQDAYAGRAISLGGTVASTVCIFDRYETFGNNVITNPGAVCALGGLSVSSVYGSEVLFGGGLYDSSLGITKAALCSLGMGRNKGSFVTAKLPTDTTSQFVDRFIAATDQMTLDTDQIIVKYRTSNRQGLPSPLAFSGTGATWTSTTTFTVDSTLKDVKNIQVGDEVVVSSGAAAGYTGHVTAIDTSAPTYVFTIDETMPVSSGTFDFIANNWKKGPIFTRSSFSELRSAVQAALEGVQGKWVQFKIELRGRDIAMQEVLIRNTTKQ